MVDDVALNKAASIERCLARVAEEYQGDPRSLENQTKQDAIVLNLQRACKTSIDLAMHLVSRFRLGVPQESRDGFELLGRASIIDKKLAERLKRMVGFRNVAIHDYQRLSLPIVRSIIEKHLEDFRDLASAALDVSRREEP